MKPTSTFKMRKQTKIMAAKFIDPHKRGEYLRAMVQAQLAEEEARRAPLSKKDKE
jgi:hypothetical protein